MPATASRRLSGVQAALPALGDRVAQLDGLDFSPQWEAHAMSVVYADPPRSKQEENLYLTPSMAMTIGFAEKLQAEAAMVVDLDGMTTSTMPPALRPL